MTCTPHILEDEDGTSATPATQSWLRRTARHSGNAARQGGVGRVGPWVAGRFWWRAGWGGRPGWMEGRVLWWPWW